MFNKLKPRPHSLKTCFSVKINSVKAENLAVKVLRMHVFHRTVTGTKHVNTRNIIRKQCFGEN